MPVTPTIEVDDTLKERSSHGSFELPIETYTDNCEIFHSLYNHWHDEMELIYIESGNGLVRLNKEILRVKAGDLIIVNRGVLHGIKTDLRNICLLFDRIHSCHKEKKPYYFVKLKALFFSFFYEMLMGNYITPADKDENKSLASIKKILDYINLNYSQPLTAAELTALSNYSEYYFMKLFKQYTGKTLITYINDLRIEKAKPMLLHSDSSVTEIALEVGFNNTSYFIKKFQQATGMSPHKFRRNLS